MKRKLTLAKCIVGLLGNEQYVRQHTVFFSSVLDEVTKAIQVKESINKKKLFQDFHKLLVGISGKVYNCWSKMPMMSEGSF